MDWMFKKRNYILLSVIIFCSSCKENVKSNNNNNDIELKCGIEELSESIKIIYTTNIEKNYQNRINGLYKKLSNYSKKDDANHLAADFNVYNDFQVEAIRLESKNNEIKKCTCKARLKIKPSSNFKSDHNKYIVKKYLFYDANYYDNWDRDNVEYENLKREIVKSTDIQYVSDITYSIQLTEDQKNFYVETVIPADFQNYFEDFFNSHIYLYNDEYLKRVIDDTWQ